MTKYADQFREQMRREPLAKKISCVKEVSVGV